MPAHHVGFLRYPKPSPSKPFFSMDAFRPFFVITKLAPAFISSPLPRIDVVANIPMASDELTASMRPIYLFTASVAVPPPPLRTLHILVFHHDVPCPYVAVE